jgi:tetratricopeptide (TPR) repeat protein
MEGTSLLTPPPPDPQQLELIQQISSLLQSGKIANAAEALEKLMVSVPKNPHLLTQLGTIHLRLGNAEKGVGLLLESLRLNPHEITTLISYANGLASLRKFEEALSVYDQVIALQNGNAMAYYNRGFILQELKRFSDSLEAYDRAIALQPSYASAYNNRGTVLQELHRFEEALKSFDQAITFKSDYAEAHNNRGSVLLGFNRWEEALEAFRRAVALQPAFIEGHYNQGTILLKLKRPAEALEAFDHAIALKADYAEAHNNRGNALRELDRMDEALKSFDQAVALRPGYVKAHNNRGTLLKELMRLDESIEAYDRAIALQSDYAEAHYNRGNALKEMKRLNESIADYDRAIALHPDFAHAYWNKALHKLLLGDFQEGWRLYEWRWKTELKDDVRSFTQPLWLGETPLDGQTLLIHAEQGFGDTLQFCRYALMAERKRAKVVLETPGALASVLATLPGKPLIIPVGGPMPPFDLQCPMMSLPLAFKTTLETIPAEIPYLFPDPIKKAFWNEALGPKTRPRVGLAWSGKPGHKNDLQRSIPLEVFRPLFELPLEFHSLQREYRDRDKALLETGAPIRDHHNELLDFSDTAALISEMDFVISVDTSVAHLSGALGKPVWILIPFFPDYRWQLDRTDSPWYPTAVLFRQTSRGDWAPVLQEVVERIRKEFIQHRL